MRTVVATRYLGPLRGSSRPILVEANDDGIYVLKLPSQGHGIKALIAEVVSATVARALGLAVPEIVVARLDPGIAAAEPDYELREAIRGGAGDVLGVDHLPGSRILDLRNAAEIDIVRPDAARIVVLDVLVDNVDRTARNPNLLLWHRRAHVFDHGVALPFHFAAKDPTAAAGDPAGALVAQHLLRPHVTDGELAAAWRLARDRVTDEVIERAVAGIPRVWIAEATPRVEAADYARFLRARRDSQPLAAL